MIWLAACLAPAFVLAAAVLWRASWRWAALYAGLMAVSVLGAVEIMGASKPVWAEWRDMEDAEVIGAHYVPNVAIYVWVLRDEPRVYRLPWSDKTAREMQQFAQQNIPYVMDYDQQDPVFHPMPQPPSPEKPQRTD